MKRKHKFEVVLSDAEIQEAMAGFMVVLQKRLGRRYKLRRWEMAAEADIRIYGKRG